MSQPLTILWPEWLAPSTFTPYHDPHEMVHEGLYSRESQVLELDDSRWRVSMQFPPCTRHQAAAAEAFLGLLRGRQNYIAMGDLRHERRVPRGTLRGNPTLSVVHAKGAHHLSLLTGQPGATLLAGDRLGLVAQLLEVALDCVADATGLLAVPLTQRLWQAYAAGTVAVWNNPRTRWRRAGEQPGIPARAGFADGWAMDLVQHKDPSVITAVVPSAPRARGDAGAVQTPAQVTVQLNVGNGVVGV